MKPTTTLILEALAKHLRHPAFHEKLSMEAALSADLDLCQIDLVGVACDIEEALAIRFDGDPELHWHTPADILASIEQVRR